MAMKVLTQHPMSDAEADTQLLALGTMTAIEGKNMIVMQNLQYQINAILSRLAAASIP